jgi:UDP-glucuronate 4-epimerase
LNSPPGLSPGTPVLLTGGAGFIGSHLAERLIGAEARVTILDDLNDAYPADLKRENLRQVSERGSFDFLQMDIGNPEELQSALSGKSYEVVIHLAARTGVRSS